jgi:hypothetical protein
MSYDSATRTINGVPEKEARMNGKIRTFATGATRDTDQGKPDFDGFLSPLVLEEYGRYMHKHRVQSDGSLRDSDNWQKGIPRPQYLKSMFRHFLDVWRLHRGYKTTDAKTGVKLTLREALTALLFNVMGYLHELLKEELATPGPELGEGARTVLRESAEEDRSLSDGGAMHLALRDLDDCGTTDGVTPLPPMSEDTHRTTPGIDENGNGVYEPACPHCGFSDPKIDRLKEDTDEDFVAVRQFDKATNGDDRYDGDWNVPQQTAGFWRIEGAKFYRILWPESHNYGSKWNTIVKLRDGIDSGSLVRNTWKPMTITCGINRDRD